MADDYPPKILHVIPCINPGLSCCDHRLVMPKQPADNVWRCEVYCGKWRENRMRDKVFHACQPEYKVQEPAVIEEKFLSIISGQRGGKSKINATIIDAEEQQRKNRLSLREEK